MSRGWKPEAHAAAGDRSRSDGIRRFWANVDASGGPEACWPWGGYIHASGYGRGGRFAGERVPHRATYRVLVGPIPDGLTLDHLCRNKACVNPRHLEPVSLGENIRRAAAVKTACPKGHIYDESNTYRYLNGRRACRACHRQREIARKRALGVVPVRRLPAAVVARIHELAASGLTTYAISQQLGMNQGTVWRIAKRAA